MLILGMIGYVMIMAVAFVMFAIDYTKDFEKDSDTHVKINVEAAIPTLIMALFWPLSIPMFGFVVALLKTIDVVEPIWNNINFQTEMKFWDKKEKK